MWELGRKKRARELADQSVAMLGGTQSVDLALALANQARLAMTDYDFEIGVRLSRKAEVLARRLGRDDILSGVLNTHGMCLMNAEQDESDRLVAESLRIALAGNHHYEAVRVLGNTGVARQLSLRYPEAMEYFDRAHAHGVEHELLRGTDFNRAFRLSLLERMGRWDEEEAGLKSMQSEGVQQYSALLTVRVLHARLMVRRGVPVSDEAMAEVVALLGEEEDVRHVHEVANLFAERAWLGLGDRTQARAWIDRAMAMPCAPRLIEEMLLWQHRLDPSRPLGSIEGVHPVFVMSLFDDWRAAAREWERIGAPYQLALTLLQGNAEAAARALNLLDELGAVAVTDHARRLIRDRGMTVEEPPRPRASTRANPAGLTPRQMDVLRLLNEGCSNAEIGERLFVSAKTVDHHVSAILAKLEVTSRGEAAALARHAGWLAARDQ